MVYNITTKNSCYFTNKQLKLINVDHTPPTAKRKITYTGSTENYVSTSTSHTNKKIAIDPIEVTIPNGDTVTSTHTCELNFPSLPKAARQAHIFPHFPAGALLSIGQLCNASCTTELDVTTLCICLQGRTILTGTLSLVTKLWYIDDSPLTPPTTA